MYYFLEPNLMIKESEVEAIQIKTFLDEDDKSKMCFKLIIYTKSNRTYVDKVISDIKNKK